MDENINKIQKKKSGNMMRNPIVYFSTIFTALFVLFLLIFPIIKSSFININMGLISITLKPYIEQRNENREIRVAWDGKSDNNIITNVIFLDRRNQEGNIVSKNISLNVFNEVYIPLILILSLVLSLPVSKKSLLKTLCLTFGCYVLFTTIKITTLILDNYRYPEWQTVNLPFLLDKIVYTFSFLLSITGYSISLTVIILIFTFAILYNFKELRRKFLPENNITTNQGILK